MKIQDLLIKTMARRHSDLIQTLVDQNIITDERIRNAMLATDRIDFSTNRAYDDSPQSSNKFCHYSQ